MGVGSERAGWGAEFALGEACERRACHSSARRSSRRTLCARHECNPAALLSAPAATQECPCAVPARDASSPSPSCGSANADAPTRSTSPHSQMPHHCYHCRTVLTTSRCGGERPMGHPQPMPPPPPPRSPCRRQDPTMMHDLYRDSEDRRPLQRRLSARAPRCGCGSCPVRPAPPAARCHQQHLHPACPAMPLQSRC